MTQKSRVWMPARRGAAAAGNRRRLLALGLVGLLSACALPATAPRPMGLPAAGPAVAVEVHLSEDGPAMTPARAALPGGAWRTARVTLRSSAARPMPGSVICDADAFLRGADGTRPAGPGSRQPVTFASRHGAPLRLDLGPDVTRCELRWGAGHALSLLRPGAGAGATSDLPPSDGASAGLGAAADLVARLDRTQSACVVPDPASAADDALLAAFYANSALSMGCAMRPGPVRVAQAPLDALSARLEALTGSPQDLAALKRGDPDMALDFSQAPRLDLIALTSLYLRADFSGTLVRRALEYHAARGTPVRILVSDALQTGKDRAFWDAAASRYPNIEIQYFGWSPRGLVPPGAALDSLHRANHVKILATLSATPGRSRLITGGRNLHDGYFFDTSFDLSDHPDLRTFDADGFDGLAWWATFRDTDVVLSDDAAVREVLSHFAKLWSRDVDGAVARPHARAGRTGEVARSGVARHFISVPWADGRALEASYVSLIDAARREITIVSPFLYPPQSIDDALLRARARGVTVRVITRRYSTEPARAFTASMSKDYINRRYTDFEIWDDDGGTRMIHTKIMIIDGRLGVSSSVNLNARSFLQDTENGLIFLDPGKAAQLMQVAEMYRRSATPVTEAQELPGLIRWIATNRYLWQYF